MPTSAKPVKRVWSNFTVSQLSEVWHCSHITENLAAAWLMVRVLAKSLMWQDAQAVESPVYCAAPAPLWQDSQSTAACAPIRGNRAECWRTAWVFTSHPFTLWQSSHLAPNCRRWMSAWQSAQCVDASRKIVLAWHWRHSTLLCIPLSGYVVSRLWLNSGTARSGFHPMEVWQLPHAILSEPCGLRTGPRCMFCCARPPISPVVNRAVNKAIGSRCLILELGSMATHAVFGRWLVEHHQPPAHFFLRAVTILARHPFMSAVQRKTGPLVIEFTGLPLDVAVTGFAALAFGLRGKLAGVNVLMTTLAGERRTLEHNLAGAERERGGAVTLLADRAAVRSGESEAGLGMIEARHLAPRPHVMADFAVLLDRRQVDRRQKAIVCPTDLGLMR